ncbi:MAG: ankyrin repeat domain-containing protein [Akkermansia sp.]|nr:ankyrin repeat domain-containing protein [Akkermansia sp.]
MNTEINENVEEIIKRLTVQCEIELDGRQFNCPEEMNQEEWAEIMDLAAGRLLENEFLLLLKLADENCNNFWEYCPGLLWDIHSSYSLDTVITAAISAWQSGYLVPVEGEAFPIMAAGWGDLELIRRLVEEVGVSVHSYCLCDCEEVTGSMLSIAAREGCVEICTYLLDKGASPNESSLEDITSPLVEAVLNNQVKVVRLLLERGATLCDLSYCGDAFSPVDYAHGAGHQEMVALLEEYSGK